MVFFQFLLNGQSLYLCSRLTSEAKERNNQITPLLEKDFTLFRPQDIDLRDVAFCDIDSQIYKKDLAGILNSDFLLVLAPYGRDCAWEMGFFCGQGKKTIAYVEEIGDWIHDAMIKGGLSAIITTDFDLYRQLLNDTASAKKSYFIPGREALNKTILEILGERGK